MLWVAVETLSMLLVLEGHFKALYNEEVQFLLNQVGGFHLGYQKLGKNQGWNQDRERDWRNRGNHWRQRDVERENVAPLQGELYIPPHDPQKPKEKNADLESFRTKDMFDRILNKVERSDKVLKEMKINVFHLIRPLLPVQLALRILRPKWAEFQHI